MQKPKQQNGRSRSFTGGGLASFLRSTVASFSSTFPSRGNGRSSFNHRNAFSGPIVSIVPPEARGDRRRQPSSSGYRTPEPSSPKVSCIGQIKRSKSKRVNPCGKNGGACPLPPRPPAAEEAGRGRPKRSFVKRVLFRRSRSRSGSGSRDAFSVGRGGKGVDIESTTPAPVPPPAPGGLGQMKRFTSGRAAFQDFDWQEAESRVHDDDEEEDEGFVAHSAPLVLGGGVVASEPKKEVNLWRRRPIAPPTPLQLP